MTIVPINKCREQKKSIGERHIYTQEIIKVLASKNVGEVATYEEMDWTIGMSTRPRGPGYGYQRTARMILERDYDIVFEVVEKIGLRRLSAEQVAESTASMYIQKKKAIIKHHKRRIKTVDDVYDELSPGAKIKTTLARTLLAFDSEMSKSKRVLSIENKVKDTAKMVGFQDTVRLFEK